MPQPASNEPQYYLGINGDQTGPYTHADVVAKIQSGTIPPDALVWYEGLDAWTPISSVPEFSSSASAGLPSPPVPTAIETPAAGSPSQVAGGLNTLPDFSEMADIPAARNEAAATAPSFERASRNLSSGGSSTFAAPGQKIEPIFKGKEGVFSRPAFITTRAGLTLLFAIFFGAIAFGVAYWKINYMGLQQQVIAKTTGGLRMKLTRGQRLRAALSELILKPKTTLPELEKIIEENPEDSVGKEALEASVEYYRRNRRYIEAGNILMKANLPLKAADFYLMEPPDHRRAETALYRAYEIEKDTEIRFEALIRNINMLLGPLNSKDSRQKAEGRIKILSEQFPGRKHPFDYYLKPIDQKLEIMFRRLEFHFLEAINNLLEADFPDITLADPPTVRLERAGGGNYRVTAKYDGDVILGRDRLKNIQLVFWSDSDSWFLVNTNLTSERRRWANAQRMKLVNKVLPGPQMLEFLESIHLNRFPKIGLHEPLKPNQ